MIKIRIFSEEQGPSEQYTVFFYELATKLTSPLIAVFFFELLLQLLFFLFTPAPS